MSLGELRGLRGQPGPRTTHQGPEPALGGEWPPVARSPHLSLQSTAQWYLAVWPSCASCMSWCMVQVPIRSGQVARRARGAACCTTCTQAHRSCYRRECLHAQCNATVYRHYMVGVVGPNVWMGCRCNEFRLSAKQSPSTSSPLLLLVLRPRPPPSIARCQAYAHAHAPRYEDATRKALFPWLPFLRLVWATVGAAELELGPFVIVGPLLAGPTCTISYPSASGRNSWRSRPTRTLSNPRYLRKSSR